MDTTSNLTVKNAQAEINELKRLSNNMRLLNQWALNADKDKLEAIADKHGISSPITKVTYQASAILDSLSDKLQTELDNTKIETDTLSFLKEIPACVSVTDFSN